MLLPRLWGRLRRGSVASEPCAKRSRGSRTLRRQELFREVDAERRRTMSRVRSTGTALESSVCRALEEMGFPPAIRNVPCMPGKPDFVWPTERVALFVHSCFWHACPAHCRMPKSRQEYWEEKIAGNRRRDARVRRELRRLGWHVCTIWEHAVLGSDTGHLKAALSRSLGRFLDAAGTTDGAKSATDG